MTLADKQFCEEKKISNSCLKEIQCIDCPNALCKLGLINSLLKIEDKQFLGKERL